MIPESTITEFQQIQGQIQDFHLEGVQKIMCEHPHHKCKAQSPIRPGSRAQLRALEALGPVS